GLAIGLAVAVGVLRARRRRHGADRPGREVSVAESVVSVARDPAEVLEDLTPPHPRRPRRRRQVG
ncbi:MAG: hypothetical protein ACXVAI_07890, partial [Candidatus Limnocylindrales bacterium]